MKFCCIYIINPDFLVTDTEIFLTTFCGEYLFISGNNREYDDYLWAHIPDKSDEFRFVFNARYLAKHRNLREVLPHYISGDEQVLNLIGYIFLLRERYLALGSEFRTQYIERVKEDYAVFQEVVPGASYVFALGYQGNKPQNEAELQKAIQSVRDEFNLDPSTKIIPCDLQSKDDIKHVVLELMDVIGDFPDREKFMPLIEAL